MKTKKYFHLAILLTIFIFTFSCKNDFLERAPDDKINEETVFSNWDKVNALCNRLYNDLRSRDRGIVTLQHFSLSGITDECKGTTVEGAIPDQFNFGSFGPSIGMPSGADGIYWNDLYSGIRQCNVFLAGVKKYNSPDNPVDPGDLKNRIAEAHFLRAYYHFLAARFYGDIAYLDYVPDVNGDLAFKQQSWPDMLTKLLEDLQFAIDELPVRFRDTEYGRADKGTAMALKAIVLYMNASPMYNGGILPGNDTRIGKEQYSTYSAEKWKLAADAAKEFMDLQNNGVPRFSLYSGNSNNFQAESNNKVYARIKQIYIDNYSIQNEFAFVLSKNKNEAWQGDHIPPSKGGAARLQPIQEQVDEYEFIGNDGYGYSIFDPNAKALGYDDTNPYQLRDPRFYSDIIYHGCTYQSSVINTASGSDRIGASNATSTGYYLRKFFHEDWKRSGNWDLNFPMIRLPEIQLIYCEATNKYSGPNSDIYYVLNTLRIRSFMAAVPPGLNADELHKYIQRERRVEFFYENKRYFYSRWNLEPTSDTEVAKQNSWNEANPNLPYPRTQKAAHGMKPVEDPIGQISIDGKKYRMERFKLEDRVFTNKNYYWPLMMSELTNCPSLIQNPNW